MKAMFVGGVVFFFLFCSSVTRAEEGQKEKKPAEAILVKEGGVLLPKGALVIEPALKYSHFSRHRMSISGFTILEAIVIGEIAVSDVKRDILEFSLTGRYGVTPRFEVEAKVPYMYRHDREVRGPGTATVREYTVSDDGLEDIEGAFYYHLIKERGWVPDVVVNLRVKAPTGRDPYDLETEAGRYEELPTGNGHWGISGGVTFVKTSDPAVFFAGVNYYWNVERDVGRDFGKVDPGDSIEYNLGIAYALSERVSLSTSFQQRFTMKTRQNGEGVPGTFMNVATLFLGMNYSLSKRTQLGINVGVGLTVDDPDVQVTVSIPIRLW